MQDAMSQYREAGLSALPALPKEKRPALPQWKVYQDRLPTRAELGAWLANKPEGLCVVCGAVSGHVELIDFDHGGEFYGPWCERIEPALLKRLVIERSQSGGVHVVYRCAEPVEGNMKLAQTADGRVMIETRGEGGLFLCSPTPGYDLVQGDLTELPVISSEERQMLLEAAKGLGEACESASASSPCQGGQSFQDRPGDDYNERGDLRALLVKHGWRYAFTSGDNEHWTRPGKSSGTSATIKDRVFYVFSSSAAPLEPNKSYSPFSLFAALEHGGDFEAAARALRLEGYGGDSQADGVDISALVQMSDACGDHLAENANLSDHMVSRAVDPKPSEVGPIPESFMEVPGLVGQMIDFCMQYAPYPNVGMAFCGAIALQSFLCGRKVKEIGGLRPNLYLLGLMSSGGGKDYPRLVNGYILDQIGLSDGNGNQIASGEGLEDAIIKAKKLLCQTDEVDNMIRALASGQASHHMSLLSMMLQLFSAAAGNHKKRIKAGEDNRTSIDQPFLTIFGTATPNCYYESLSETLLTNGLFSRSIVIDIMKRGRGNRNRRDVSALPEEIIETARWWRDYTPVGPDGKPGGNLSDEHPTPSVVPASGAGEDVLYSLMDEADDNYDAAIRASGDPVDAIVWSRAYENAAKLATIYACSRDHQEPVIDDEAAKWAVRFIKHLVGRMLYMVHGHVAANAFDSDCLRVMRKLESEPTDQISHSKLLKYMRIEAGEFGKVINTLEQQGRLETIVTPTSGRPSRGYRLT